ncbi:hypothetical protein E3U55_10585 [Filobacillus milosensis]|uniref:Lipoprotein n=1 Tax=Filobacillus milosensis TaxID=94137 RepID=A0A4Y8IG56_9BACI|nr:hypothetical protein [Filobacillus milosensis]TFB19597.1 hypothetical protein E3U55_10585 [Filobacillus milosensis]
MKNIIIIVVLLLITTACSTNHKNLEDLNRVDVHQNGEDWMVTDQDEIDQLREIFKSIEWREGSPRKEQIHNLKLVLFFLYDKNMPERLVDYYIWADPTQILLWDKEENRMGMLNQSASEKLLNIIHKK